MGVEPFLVASTVEAVMAQRLVRRLCRHCRQPFQPTNGDVPPDFPLEALAAGQAYRTGKCRACHHTGYAGRVALFELLVTTEEIRQLAHDRASTWSIRKCALKQGMSTLRQDGWRKVVAGITTLDEVLRVTKGDRLAE
jgi:general secretion pathway protein E/type IV pilus assembly protein PilB